MSSILRKRCFLDNFARKYAALRNYVNIKSRATMGTVFPRRKFFHRGLSGKSFAAGNYIFSRFARKKTQGRLCRRTVPDSCEALSGGGARFLLLAPGRYAEILFVGLIKAAHILIADLQRDLLCGKRRVLQQETGAGKPVGL